MTFQGDPYRTLGLAPGASVNEVRSAYRRLAKRYHPDAAGERALPRFLSIQAAYEALVDANGDLRRRPKGTAPAGAGGGGAGSQADPSRARASRDAWRARGRPASPGSDGASPPPRGGQGDPAGTDAGSGERRRPGANTEHHHRRHHRTATPGSTTYDEAGETPLDPSWDGGTWYGASSGTYWTLNPREYADPRKHGPEYRRRAWRAAGHRGPEPSAPPAHEEADEPSPAPAPAPAPPPAPTGTAGSAPEQPSGSSASGYSTEDRPASARIPATTPLAGLLPEGLLARAHGGALGRAIVALVATVPALWLASIILTGLAGCSAGGCPPLIPALAVVAWAVAALLAATLPVASALGAFAVLVAAAATLVSGTILALASGDPVRGVVQAAGTLGIVIYCFALVIGGARLYGRREVDRPEA